MPEEVTNYYSLSKDDVLKKLETQESGLTQAEAAKRLVSYGKNAITSKKKISPLALYLQQFKNTLTLILIAAALLILFIYYFGEKEQSDLIEAGLILAIVFMITLTGFIQEYKAEKAIESLKKLLAFKAKVRRNGTEEEILVADLVPGDVVILEEGTKIPADMRLIEVYSLSVNEASLTGESVPANKASIELEGNKQLGDQKNMAFSGTSVASGRAIGIVVRTGDRTEIGKIAQSVAQTEDEETPIQRRLDEIGKLIGYVILGICAIVFVFIMFFAQGFADQPLLQRVIHSFIAAVALAVAAIPEGLPAVVTISLALGTQRMLKRNALVRKLNSVETLGSTDTICSDKTGTLTKGEMTVTSVYYANHLYEVTGTGYDTEGKFTDGGKEMTKFPFSPMLEAGLYCNNAKLTDGKVLGDPTEAALLVSAIKAGIKKHEAERVLEIPFSSERKMMSVVVKQGEKYILYAKGATEVILEHSFRVTHSDKEVPLVNKDKKDILDINHTLSTQALRNLGFAYKEMTKTEFEKVKDDEKQLEKGLTFLGIQGMIDPPRIEVKELITQCTASGIRVIMITGDHPETAKAVAGEIGILGDALTGDALSKMDEKELAKAVEHTSIYARVNPDTKLRIVAALQKNGHIVAMTGDGVNDAPALKKADIGIAMGITGTDVAKEASDMVLLDDKFSTIVSAIEEGRGIFHNIRKFVIYLLSCNLAEVLIVFFGIIILQDLVLTATMLLWINVVTDGLPAVALGLDPAEKGIMRYSPRAFQTQIISKRLWVEMWVFGIFLSVFVLGAYMLNMANGVASAQGAAFTTLVIFELLSIYLIRSGYQVPFFSNKWLLISIIVTLGTQLAIVYIPLFNTIFGIAPLQMNDWIFILLASLWLFFAFQLIRIALDKVFDKD
jgi:P-type Ca2+ transporter type 2C